MEMTPINYDLILAQQIPKNKSQTCLIRTSICHPELVEGSLCPQQKGFLDSARNDSTL